MRNGLRSRPIRPAPGSKSADEPGNQGHHGYLSTNTKMNATIIAWGRGIKVGARIGLIDNIDVAPTIAHLLGQELRDADGRVLCEILLEHASQ